MCAQVDAMYPACMWSDHLSTETIVVCVCMYCIYKCAGICLYVCVCMYLRYVFICVTLYIILIQRVNLYVYIICAAVFSLFVFLSYFTWGPT